MVPIRSFNAAPLPQGAIVDCGGRGRPEALLKPFQRIRRQGTPIAHVAIGTLIQVYNLVSRQRQPGVVKEHWELGRLYQFAILLYERLRQRLRSVQFRN